MADDKRPRAMNWPVRVGERITTDNGFSVRPCTALEPHIGFAEHVGHDPKLGRYVITFRDRETAALFVDACDPNASEATPDQQKRACEILREFFADERELPPAQPGSWRDVQPNSIAVEERPSLRLSGPAMTGRCTSCGVDLDDLARRGKVGHVCFGPGDSIDSDPAS